MTRVQPVWGVAGWKQLSLPLLSDDEDGAVRWSFAIVALQRAGRVTLPPAARAALGGCGSPRMAVRGEVVLVRGGGAGRRVTVDGRGRVVVPCWLRDAAEPSGSILVAARSGGDAGPLVVLAPSRLLAGVADELVGEG